MDNQRLLILAFFVMMCWITYQTWLQDYAPRPAQPVAEQGVDSVNVPAAKEGGDDLPEISDAPATGGAEALPTTPGVAEESTTKPAAPTVRVRTDVLDVEISTLGGTLQSATILK